MSLRVVEAAVAVVGTGEVGSKSNCCTNSSLISSKNSSENSLERFKIPNEDDCFNKSGRMPFLKV